jgi:HEAT repeat protein
MTKPEGNKFVITCIILLLASPLFFFCGCNGSPALQQGGAGFSTDPLEQQATSIIQQAFAGNDPRVRANAVEVVATIPMNRGRNLMSEAQRLLKDEFTPVRFAAAVAAGDTRYSPARGDVTQLLRDEDQNVRLAADYAIVKLSGSGASGEQIRAAMTSPDQKVRANAAFLLGKLGDRAVLPLLYEAIRDDSSDDRVRLNSIEAIARLGDERIYQKLWAMLISAYADDRVCGIQAMGALGTIQARDALLTMLKDDLIEVRLVAAEQLGNLGETEGEKIVLNALTEGIAAAPDQEGKERIHRLAALAIGQIRTPAVKKFLPGLLRSESQFVRLAAARAVFQCAARDNIGR